MSKQRLSPLRKRELAADRRALLAPQHDYDGKGPAWTACHNCQAAKRQRDLIMYAAALGRKRGLLPDNLSDYRALDIRRDDGTAVVEFQRCKLVTRRWGETSFEPIEAEEPIRVVARFLDWVPDQPSEHLLYEEAA